MKYLNYEITLSEIPEEITLTILITGCPNGCPDCHSKFAWDKNNGNEINADKIEEILKKYKDTITCVCFLGGEWESNNLSILFDTIKKYKIKVALYSGLDKIEQIDTNILNKLDYLKIGSYKKEKGSINKKTTNQRLFRIESLNFEDITHLLQR